MNDPNGLVYHKGEYHLFYQYHPGSDVWGSMHWGHAVSRDLIHWRHLPPALFPDENDVIFSGSAVIDRTNSAGFGRSALVAVFSYHKDRIETQNLAFSVDRGRTFVKYPGNPVIPHPGTGSEFRDPKVFRYQDVWVMALAAGRSILFYTSRDLKRWEPGGAFGDGHGCTEGVWETPEMFQLPVQGTDESRWVLTVGVGNGAPAGGSGTQYFVGHFDGRTFISDNSKEKVFWADYGADYYAPQSWNNEPNGRRLIIGWMKNWKYANLVPSSGWRGAFTVIREASLQRTPRGIRLFHQPIPELHSLRGPHHRWRNEKILPGTNILSDVRGKAIEILAEFQPTDTGDCFGFRVRMGEAERTVIQYNIRNKQLLVDRTRSGRVDFSDGFAAVHRAELTPMDGRIRLHLFIDSASVEVFANDGQVAFSECIFPAEESQGLELFVEGGIVLLNSLDVYLLNRAGFTLPKP